MANQGKTVITFLVAHLFDAMEYFHNLSNPLVYYWTLVRRYISQEANSAASIMGYKRKMEKLFDFESKIHVKGTIFT